MLSIKKFSCLIGGIFGRLAGAFLVCGLVSSQALEVHNLVTPKGIKVWFSPDKSIPVVSMAFSFENAGDGSDAPGKEGLSSLAMSMMTEGAGPYTANALSEKMAELGCVIALRADDDYARGFFKTTYRRLNESVALFKTVVKTPTFPQDRLELMRDQMIPAIHEGLKQPGQILGELIGAKMYPAHPYGRSSRVLLTTLPTLKREDLQSYLSTSWGRSNLRVSICGHLTKDEVIALVDGVFGHLPATVSLKPVAEVISPYNGETHHVKQDIPQSLCVLMHPGVSLKDPHYFTMKLIANILGDGFQSRLVQEVREKRGLAYSVAAMNRAMPHSASLSINLGTENAKVDEAIAVIKAEFKKLADQGVTDVELQDAKTAAIGSFVIGLSNTGAIATLLQTYQEIGFEPSLVNERAHRIKSITKAQMDAFLKSFFHPEKLTVFVVGNAVPKTGPAPTPSPASSQPKATPPHA